MPFQRIHYGQFCCGISIYVLGHQHDSLRKALPVESTDQICAVGLAVQKMVSLHGIALNASTELSYDTLINPCGLTGRGITSLSKEAGRPVGVEEAKEALLAELARTFDVTFTTNGN